MLQCPNEVLTLLLLNHQVTKKNPFSDNLIVSSNSSSDQNWFSPFIHTLKKKLSSIKIPVKSKRKNIKRSQNINK